MGFIQSVKVELEMMKRLKTSFLKSSRLQPERKLYMKKIGETTRYYYRDAATGKEHYISRKESALLDQLIAKEAARRNLEMVEENILLLEPLLENYHDLAALVGAEHERSGQARAGVGGRPGAEAEAHRAETGACRGAGAGKQSSLNYHTEELRHQTTFGLRVRSKSEALIAELLHSHDIPFSYEPQLRIKDRDGNMKSYYPDFIIHLPDGRKIIWEHFGLFGDETYRENFLERMTDYYYQGIISPSNLIITMDGPDGSFDVAAVERVIRGMILPFFA